MIVNAIIGGLVGALVASFWYGHRMRRLYLGALDKWVAALEKAEDDLEYVISGERPNQDARPDWLYREP